SKINGVTESNVNFMTKMLRFDIEAENEEAVLAEVKQTIKVLEPEIKPTLKTGEQIGADGLPVKENKPGRNTDENSTQNEHTHSHGALTGEEEKKEKMLATMRLLVGIAGLLAGAFAPVSESIKLGFYIARSEEHTYELQSRFDLVCRLLLDK